MERIGLIAGGGKLPVIFAEEARKKGAKIIGFAIKGMALPELDKACDRIHKFSIGEVKKFIFLLIAERIKKIVMLGKVDKSIIFSNVERDDEAEQFLKETESKSDYSLLDKLTSELEKRRMQVIDSAGYLADLFPPKGVLTKRELSEKEKEDVLFGFKAAKDIARLDIGQTVVVKDKNIVSVEAMEGTDRTIERASGLCGSGFSVVKVSRPDQDMRWDVPVAGEDTIRLIVKYGGSVLAIEEKKMFLVDRESCIRLADASNISIVVV